MLAITGERGLVVLPVRWRADERALFAALPAETLALAGAGPDAPVALMVDRRRSGARATWSVRWCRAGLVLRADGGSAGAKSAPLDRARRSTPDADALVRITPGGGVVEGLVQRERGGRDDAPSESSVEVDAPPELVWEVASDPQNLPHWDRHIEAA